MQFKIVIPVNVLQREPVLYVLVRTEMLLQQVFSRETVTEKKSLSSLHICKSYLLKQKRKFLLNSILWGDKNLNIRLGTAILASTETEVINAHFGASVGDYLRLVSG